MPCLGARQCYRDYPSSRLDQIPPLSRHPSAFQFFIVSFQLQQFTRIRLGFRTEISIHDALGLLMKKLIAALAVTAALTGSAVAADLGARPYTKAPCRWRRSTTGPASTSSAVAAAVSGLPNGGVDVTGGPCIVCTNTRTGGDGWFGTVGAGYDWQNGPSWVVGIFGDGTFGSLKGNIGDASIFGSSAPQRWRRLGQPVLVLATSLLRTFSPTSTAVTPGPTGRAAPCWAPLPALRWAAHRQLQYPRLVRRRRRREQPEHLRNQRSRLVHEDGISCGLSMTAKNLQENGSMAPTCRPASTSPSNRSCRPSALRWSTASTGVALRSSQVLISANSSAQKPRHGPGLFCWARWVRAACRINRRVCGVACYARCQPGSFGLSVLLARLAAYHDWACKNKEPALLACLVPDKPMPIAELVEPGTAPLK